jgi:hypothetical protein
MKTMTFSAPAFAIANPAPFRENLNKRTNRMKKRRKT